MSTAKWAVDPSHSSVSFTARHMIVAKVRGTFTRWSASVALDEEDLTRSKIEATIETASIDTREPKRDEHLRSADFLDVEKFPEMVYRSKKIEKLSSESYRVLGDLTIRGVMREIPLEVEYGGRMKDPWGNERAVFTGTTTIERKDFGLTWNVALETGGVLVGDKVGIEIEVE